MTAPRIWNGSLIWSGQIPHSTPPSPMPSRSSAVSPNLRGVRDSGDFNTPGSVPMSPLLNSSANSDTLSEGLKNMRRPESASRPAVVSPSVAPPLSPRIVINDPDNTTDVSLHSIQLISLRRIPAARKFIVGPGYRLQCKMPNRTNHKFPSATGVRAFQVKGNQLFCTYLK